MRVIIAGSRTVEDLRLLRKVVEDSGFIIDEVVSGGAKGVDRLGENYARNAGLDLVIFPANWNRHGKAAGPIRNERMASYASSDKSRRGGLIAIWKDKSRGTGSMIKLAEQYGLKIYIHSLTSC